MKDPFKVFMHFVIALSIVSCHSKDNGFIVGVKYEGALKNMMQKGDITAKAKLSAFEGSDHLYALGALEDLKGEIQIFDGRPFITSEKENHIEIDTTFDKNASLLVYVNVELWREIILPADIDEYGKLENWIFDSAKENNININYPFPFLLEGKVSTMEWHIVNWNTGDFEHTHEKHITSGPHGTLLNQEVIILGFYSDAHHGIFTHHTTNMHLHMKTKDKKLAGHVDDLLPGTRMKLKLPLHKHHIE